MRQLLLPSASASSSRWLSMGQVSVALRLPPGGDRIRSERWRVTGTWRVKDRLERGEPLGHLRADVLDSVVQIVNMRKLLGDHEALMGGEVTG